MDRRARFGAASKRFSVNQPWSRFDETYVARPADTPGDDVASALRLDPFGTHVLLGAIGRGSRPSSFEQRRSFAQRLPMFMWSWRTRTCSVRASNTRGRDSF